jgi:hypothetical protein
LNKQGSARDVLLIAVLIFALGIGFFVVNFMINESVTRILAVDTINDSASARAAFLNLDSLVDRLDYIMSGFFIGFILFMMISGWFIGGHPVFMVIYFIFVIVATAISPILSNIWEQVTTSSVFGTTISAFPFTNHVLTYLPIYVAAIGIVGMIVMFAKPYVGGQE